VRSVRRAFRQDGDRTTILLLEIQQLHPTCVAVVGGCSRRRNYCQDNRDLYAPADGADETSADSMKPATPFDLNLWTPFRSSQSRFQGSRTEGKICRL